MIEIVQLRVPNLGDFEDVEVIEVLVAVGDTIAVEDPLITVETDKASIDVPSEVAGKIVSLSVDVGSKVSAGNILAEIAPSAVPDKPHDEAQVVTPSEIEAVVAGVISKTGSDATYSATLLVIGSGPGGYTCLLYTSPSPRDRG